MTHILIEFQDQSIAIMQFFSENPSNEDIQAEIDRSVFEKTVSSWQVIDPQNIPQDRTFRNAWKPDLTVDMPRAREIHKNNMRMQRMQIFPKLDADYLRADEAGNSQQKQIIAAKKQQLRDVTLDPGIEAAQTPEELKAVWPEILGESTIIHPNNQELKK